LLLYTSYCFKELEQVQAKELSPRKMKLIKARTEERPTYKPLLLQATQRKTHASLAFKQCNKFALGNLQDPRQGIYRKRKAEAVGGYGVDAGEKSGLKAPPIGCVT
jgi:hypothetical protein